MSNIVPVPRGGLVQRSADRSVDRFIARVDGNARQELAIIEAQVDLQSARVHAVGYIGKQAMQSVAMVSQLEGQLAELVPLATTRLQAIADMTTLATAEVVAGTLRKISR